MKRSAPRRILHTGMDSQAAIIKRGKRRLIAIVAVLGVLILIIVGVSVASSSDGRPVGITYLNTSHGRLPYVALTNRTDDLLNVTVSLQYQEIDRWVEWNGSVSRLALGPHANTVTSLTKDAPASARLHLRIQNILPSGISGIGPRLRTYWCYRQTFKKAGASMSGVPNPFTPGLLSWPKEYFIPLNTITNASQF